MRSLSHAVPLLHLLVPILFWFSSKNWYVKCTLLEWCIKLTVLVNVVWRRSRFNIARPQKRKWTTITIIHCTYDSTSIPDNINNRSSITPPAPSLRRGSRPTSWWKHWVCSLGLFLSVCNINKCYLTKRLILGAGRNIFLSSLVEKCYLLNWSVK